VVNHNREITAQNKEITVQLADLQKQVQSLMQKQQEIISVAAPTTPQAPQTPSGFKLPFTVDDVAKAVFEYMQSQGPEARNKRTSDKINTSVDSENQNMSNDSASQSFDLDENA